MKLTQVLFVTVCLTLFVGMNPHKIKESSERPLFWKEVFKDAATLKIGKRRTLQLTGTRQISTWRDKHSDLAIDGNKNQHYFKGGSCTLTKKATDPWWEMFVLSLAHIKSITVYNRVDDLTERLNGFKVLVSNDSLSYVKIADGPKSTRNTPVITLNLDAVATIVRIQVYGYKYLTLCEVEIYGSYVGAYWGSWSAWEPCSKSCDGTQQRSRSCKGFDPDGIKTRCSGRSTEKQTCDTSHRCPIHGNWGKWSAWESCSVTCGGGTQQRSRSCNDPAPQYGGNDCGGDSTEIQNCNENHCPINGNWGKWSAWERCTTTCGPGTHRRWRSCNDPAPQYGGNDCVGDSIKTKNCSQPECPVHGNWGKWSAWESCSETCGEGTQQRSRSCNDPEPQYGGNDCVGDSTEIQNCRLTRCLVQMKLEYTTYEKIYNNDLFFTGDIVQCSPSVMNVIKSTSIQFSCPSMTTITENCNDNICQLILNFIDSSPKTCTLVCNATVTDVKNYKVNADKLSIISDENVILRLEEVNPAEGNLRESNYHVKCIVNRIDAVHSLYIMQDCDDSNDKIQKFYCDKRNCEVKISVENKNAYCNISCRAELKDNIKLNKLKIDWKIVCITPQWSEWSICSQTCDTGWQTRQRQCSVQLTDDEDHEDETCYEGDYRPCVMDSKCDKPDDDPPLYFPPRQPPKAEIQYLWDLTPSARKPKK